jgi:hypothetical protein
MIIADVVVVGSMEFGTAAPSPMQHERWLTHIGYVPSETPLPERLATFTDQTSASSAPSGTAIRDEIGAVMNRLDLAGILPTSEETQAAVDEMIAASRAARGVANSPTRIIKRRVR